jgi:CubicO group peptidase (beta-lactamase class C family)
MNVNAQLAMSLRPRSFQTKVTGCSRKSHRFAWKAAAVLLVGCVAGWLLPRISASADAIDAAGIDRLCENALRFWHVPGMAVGIVRNDDVVYLKGLGVKRLGSPEPVTPDTLFALASCTKAFTTAALAMLVDEGKLAWDDPVRKHVDYFHLSDPLADANVTLRDLVTHRTGLGGNDLLWYRAPWDRREIIRRIGLVKPKYSFRSTFQYQSTMFAVAGCAVESASHMKWEDFVQRRILDPLEMTGTNFTTTAAQSAGDHATPHRHNAQGKIETIAWYPMTQPDPAGSMNAGARDLCRWVRFQLGDGTFQVHKLVSPQALAETHAPQIVIPLKGPAREMNPLTHSMSYAMAWVVQDYRGHLQISHAGAIDGFRAHITFLPDDRVGIVLLNNLHNSEMNLALGNAIIDHLLGFPVKDWNDCIGRAVEKRETAAREKREARQAVRHYGTHPSREQAAYAGDYENPAYGTAHLSVENGALRWKWGAFNGELEHFHYDTFTLANDMLGRPEVLFTLDASGDVATMKVLDLMDVEFKKVKHPG